MAETLGSLVDKLTIKSIREFHLKEILKLKKPKFPKKQVKHKLSMLKKQKVLFFKEIDQFISLASSGKIHLREEKLKLYNRPQDMGKIGKISTIPKAIDALARKNLELWHLEDEARRNDVSLSYIGKIKKKIDLANQQRNDLIDKLDELLETKVKKRR